MHTNLNVKLDAQLAVLPRLTKLQALSLCMKQGWSLYFK